MPWFDLIVIDFFAILIALVPTVAVCIFLEPFDIVLIISIFHIVIFVGRIEDIDREPELMFTRSWRGAEGVRTTPEIPETFLIVCTAVRTDHRERDSEMFMEVFREFPESVSCLFSEFYIASSNGRYIGSTDGYEITWLIVTICERSISTDESIDTRIIIERERIIFFMDYEIFRDKRSILLNESWKYSSRYTQSTKLL